MTVFDHFILDIICEIFSTEGYQIICFHNIFYRNALVDQSGDGKCIIRGTDNDNLPFMGQFDNFFRNFDSHSHNNTAYILGNGLQMVFLSVTHDDQVIFFYVSLQHLWIGSSYHNLTIDKISMLISLNHCTSNGLCDPLILGLRSGQKIAVCSIHISLRNITDSDQTFQLSFPVSDRKRYNTLFHHQVPCILQRHAFICLRTHADIHIFHLSSDVGKISRRLHAETVQHIFCFFIDLSGTFRNIFHLLRSPVFNIRISNS